MRYKRINAVVLDVSSVPTDQIISTVHPFLQLAKLSAENLKSVQVHSSRKRIYLGLADDRSAAAVAAETSRFQMVFNGTPLPISVAFVDEDVVDVRVRDLPPETPNETVQNTLQKYGEVLSVTNEVWRDFFPGVLTGARIARMRIKEHIPSFISIGNNKALVNYSGQPADEKKKKKTLAQHNVSNLVEPSSETPDNSSTTPRAILVAAPADNVATADHPMEEVAASDGFTEVKKKNRSKRQNQCEEDSSDSMDEAVLRLMGSYEANRLNARNYAKWRQTLYTWGKKK